MLVLQDQVSRQARCCQWNEKVKNSLAGNTAVRTCKAICAIWAVAPHFAVHDTVQWKHHSVCNQIFKFQIPSSVPGTTYLSTRLLLQYYTTSFGTTSKAQHTKHILPILMTYSSEFWSLFKGFLMKCYIVLWYPFYHDCRSVMSDTVVSTKYHILTVMINMNSHWHGLYLLVLAKFFHYALKWYFI
jgi:hypothetical protein